MVGIRRDHIYITWRIFCSWIKSPRIIWFASNYPWRHLIVERFGESIQSQYLQSWASESGALWQNTLHAIFTTVSLTQDGHLTMGHQPTAEAWIGGVVLLSPFFNSEHPRVAPSDKTPYTRSLLRTLAPPEARITKRANAGGENFIVTSQQLVTK